MTDPKWDMITEDITQAFADSAVPIELRHAADQARTSWRERIIALGLDPLNERDLFAFVAGLSTFRTYIVEAAVMAGMFDPVPREAMSKVIDDVLFTALGLLGPYLEAHVPPGTVGSATSKED